MNSEMCLKVLHDGEFLGTVRTLVLGNFFDMRFIAVIHEMGNAHELLSTLGTLKLFFSNSVNKRVCLPSGLSGKRLSTISTLVPFLSSVHHTVHLQITIPG